MKLAGALPSDTLDRWLASIGGGELFDQRVPEAAADLVATISERPSGTHGALFRFGATLGSDGWPISVVSDWLAQLCDHLDRRSRALCCGSAAHSALAQGWAEAYVRGAHMGMCLDPVTGLVTATVLRLRLQEAYESAAADGVAATDAHAMVLIDVDLLGAPGLVADLLLACVAHVVQSVFDRGETIARVGNRMLVLAERRDDIVERCEMLSDRLRLDAGTYRGHACVVLDELPGEAVVERYLRDVLG